MVPAALQAQERRHRRDPDRRRPQAEPRLAGLHRHQQGQGQDPPLPQHHREAAGARDRPQAPRARAAALRPLAQEARLRARAPRGAGPGARGGDPARGPLRRRRLRQGLDAPGARPAAAPGEARARPPEKPRPLADAVKRLLRRDDERIKVKGTDDLLVYRAKCCNPIMGEPIVGYITRGKGVSVHSHSCPNVTNLVYDPERRIAVEWEAGGGGRLRGAHLGGAWRTGPGPSPPSPRSSPRMKTDIRDAQVRTFDDTAPPPSSSPCASTTSSTSRRW